MDGEQAARWAAAQEGVPVGADLVAAALRQLQFLAAVDRRRWLYEAPLLDRAIRRFGSLFAENKSLFAFLPPSAFGSWRKQGTFLLLAS